MDILDYFHLNEHPFRLGPDPRFLYLSAQVKEAMAKCEYMTQERVGPLYIYGPIGSGKTTLMRRLYELLSTNATTYTMAMLISANIKTSNAFLRLIMEAFGVKTERSYAQSLKNFERFLIEQYQAGKIPLLLVDEAQNLTRDTLKLIHYLLNFETADVKLLQIVLIGQEELAARIIRYQELASRMFPIAINAMSPIDLQDMVQFRWMVAGGKEPPLREANGTYKTLYTYSKGLPRDAVKICDELLRTLLFAGKKHADIADVERVSKSLNLAATL